MPHKTVEAAEAGVADVSAALRKEGPAGYWRRLSGSGAFAHLLCALVLLSALGLNLYQLGGPSIWFDEVLSIERAQQTLPVLLQIISHSQPNMALYYILLHYWLSFVALFQLPPNEFVARFPSAIFAACSAALVFLLGRRFAGLFAAVIAAVLYLLNNLQLYYAQDARAYGMQLMLLCLSWYAFLVILSAQTQRWRWWICYVGISTLAVYTHLFSLFVLPAQLCAFATLLLLPGPWRARMLGLVRPLIASACAFCVLVAPLLIASRVGSKTAWLPIPHPGDIYYLFLTISDNSKLFLLLLSLCIAGSLCIALAAYLPNVNGLLKRLTLALPVDEGVLALAPDEGWEQVELPFIVGLFYWMCVPVVASYIVSQRSDHLFSSRYLVVIVPAFFLLVGAGFTLLRWRVLRALIAFCLLLLAILYVPAYYASAQVENWRTASQWLVENYQSDDGLVCYNNDQGCQLAMNYELRLESNGKIYFPDDAPGAFPWVDYDETNHVSANFRAAIMPTALRAYGAAHPRIFFTTARVDPDDKQLQVARRWLNTHYTLLKQIVTSTVTIRLYETQAPESRPLPTRAGLSRSQLALLFRAGGCAPWPVEPIQRVL